MASTGHRTPHPRPPERHARQRPRRPLLIVLAALVAVTLFTVGLHTGCKLFESQKKKKEALAFNQSLVKHNERLQELGKKVGVKLGQRLAGKGNVSNAELEEGVARLRAEVQRIRKAVKRQQIPDDDTARALRDAYQTFLDAQEGIVGRIEQAVHAVTRPTRRAGRRQIQQIQQILEGIQAQEKKALARLQQAQQRYAKAHGIKLKL